VEGEGRDYSRKKKEEGGGGCLQICCQTEIRGGRSADREVSFFAEENGGLGVEALVSWRVGEKKNLRRKRARLSVRELNQRSDIGFGKDKGRECPREEWTAEGER